MKLTKQEIARVVKAIEIRDMIAKTIGITPTIKIAKNNNVDIRASPHTTTERIRQLAKALDVTFYKKLTGNGFLKYTTEIDGIKLTMNTNECFYGGPPDIQRHIRTKAFCKIRKD